MRRSPALLISVFITGAAVLVVEVTATRLLSSYFGSTIYTVSSVLSVVLGALAIGYAVGGRLADRWPRRSLFFGLIVASGFSLLLLQVLAAALLPVFGRELGVSDGPLVASLVLFTIPSLILGTLSPFAISLLQTDRGGTVAGTVFAVSTVGSIVGSLLAGFVLIPSIGLKTIVLATAGVLFALGFVGLLSSHRARLTLGLAVVSLLTASLIPAPQAVNANVLLRDDGRYETLIVYEGTYQGQPTRYLAQDRNSSSAMHLNSDELVFPYTQTAALLPLLKPDARSIAALGAGAYSVPKYLYSALPAASIQVAETEPRLRDIAREHFRLPDDPRLSTQTIDARRLVNNHPNTFDVIYGDAYSSALTVPHHLMTREFFEESRRALKPGGVFMANIIGALGAEPPSFLLSGIKTFREAFPNSFFIAIKSPLSDEIQNVTFVGLNFDQPVDLAALAGQHEIAARAERQLIHVSHELLASQMIFTDNHAPVEYLIGRELAERD